MKKILFSALLTLSAPLLACTNFVLQSEDKALINGRSMEFAADLNSQLIVTLRGKSFTSPAPGNNKGITWASKYGYVGFNALNQEIMVDGLNEEGLSFGALWLPDSLYPVIKDTSAANIIALEMLGDWLLGNFKSVAEVKESLPLIQVWAHDISWFQNTIPPLHYTLSDKEGQNLVIEFIKGQVSIHDNPLGVLTNNPPFEWQLNNLRNYVTVTSVDVGSIKLGPLTITSTGQGSGLFGIPGDWTPPSRFVRAAFFKSFAAAPKEAEGGVILAAHILNTVDIPFGDVRDPSTGKKVAQASDYTQWAVIKDITNKKFYYRDYKDLTLRVADLTKIDFVKGEYKPLSVSEGKAIVDITSRLKK